MGVRSKGPLSNLQKNFSKSKRQEQEYIKSNRYLKYAISGIPELWKEWPYLAFFLHLVSQTTGYVAMIMLSSGIKST